MIDCGWQGGSQYKLFVSLCRMKVTLRVEFKSQNVILKSLAHLHKIRSCSVEGDQHQQTTIRQDGDEESMMPFIHWY